MPVVEPFQRKDRDGWWIRFKDPTRRKGHQWVTRRGGDTKEQATIRRAVLVSKLEAVRLGVVDRRQYELTQQSQRPIDDVLAEYERHLAGKRRSRLHQAKSRACIRAVLYGLTSAGGLIAKGINAHSLEEIEVRDVERFLADLLDAGRSYSTRNEYLGAMNWLLNWAVKRAMLAVNPLARIEHLNADKDPRRPSRAMTFEELDRLLDATPDATRSLYYLMAGRAGLRWSEVRSLRWSGLDLESGWVTLEAGKTKAGRGDVVPLTPTLVQRLAAIRPAEPTGRVFATMPTLRTWKNDLRRARIIGREVEVGKEKRKVWAGDDNYRNELGQLDRKSLRATFVTHLAARGVDLTTATKLARHTDPRLTLKHYAKAHLLDLRGAVSRLEPTTAEPAAKEKSA